MLDNEKKYSRLTNKPGKPLKKSRSLCWKNQEKNKKYQLKSQEKIKNQKDLVRLFFMCFTPRNKRPSCKRHENKNI